MKNGFKDIIGKRIAAVVVAKGGNQDTTHQVFLVFHDGSRFEIYGQNFSCCAGVDRANGIAEYVENGGGKVTHVYGEAAMLEPARAALSTGHAVLPSDRTEAPESLEGLLTRDLNAWIEAKAAVERARRRGNSGRPPLTNKI